MFGLYTKREVKKLVARLKEEYAEVLKQHVAAMEELKERNRVLAARVSELEAERTDVSDALIHAVKEGENIRAESALSAQNERREFLLLAEKCRLLSERLMKKYPDQEDAAAFAAFSGELSDRLQNADEDDGFNLDDVLSPKEPLDLGKLCRELGLMDDE